MAAQDSYLMLRNDHFNLQLRTEYIASSARVCLMESAGWRKPDMKSRALVAH